MDGETPFRLTVLAGFLFAPAMFYYRLRSQKAGKERLDRRQEGWFVLLTLRPFAFVTMAGLIAWLVAPSAMAWSQFPLPTALRWVGAPLGLVGGSLVLWTFHHLGKNLTDTVVTRSTATLVISGPYRYVRHPFYDAFFLCVLGNALLSASWIVLGGGMAVFTLLVIRTRREEDRLIARFGDDYRQFMKSTGRFLPRLPASPLPTSRLM